MHVDCRFTGRSLEVTSHAHGIKLTLHIPDLDVSGREVTRHQSVFLDQSAALLLAYELNRLSGNPAHDAKVEDALRNLTAALIGAGY